MATVERVVVTNTTPIISLSLIGRLSLLQQLYGELLVPPAVHREVLAGGASRVGVAEFRTADWLRQVPLNDPARADLLADLDRGEAEAIALAQEVGAHLLLVDERLARRHAERIGIAISGTAGVLLRAKEEGLVKEVGPSLDQLRRGGIHLGEELVERVLRLAGEG